MDHMKLVLSLFVGIILTASLLAPVVSEASATTSTICNEGMRMSLADGEAHTITFSDTEIITDGVGQSLPDTSVYGSALIMYGNYSETSGGFYRLMSYGQLYYWGTVGSTGGARSLGDFRTATIEIDTNNAATATNSGATSRVVSNVVLYPDPAGELVLTYNPYVLRDSPIYACGYTTVDGVDYGLSFEGTASAVSVSSIYPPSIVGSVTINKTNVVTDLYQIQNVAIEDTTANATFYYSYFVAPYEVTYTSYAAGLGYASLLGGVTLIILVSLVVLAVPRIRDR